MSQSQLILNKSNLFSVPAKKIYRITQCSAYKTLYKSMVANR